MARATKNSTSGGRLRSKPQTTGLRHDGNHASLGVTRSRSLRRRHARCGIAVKSRPYPARRRMVRGLRIGGVSQRADCAGRREYGATEPLRSLAFGDRRAAHADLRRGGAHLTATSRIIRRFPRTAAAVFARAIFRASCSRLFFAEDCGRNYGFTDNSDEIELSLVGPVLRPN
jgi:hypothetical protein